MLSQVLSHTDDQDLEIWYSKLALNAQPYTNEVNSMYECSYAGISHVYYALFFDDDMTIWKYSETCL